MGNIIMGEVFSCDQPCMFVERNSIEPDQQVELLASTITSLNTKVEVLQLESYYKSRLIENLTTVNEALKVDNEDKRRRLSTESLNRGSENFKFHDAVYS